MDKRTSTIPLPETFPVETMDDWLKIKPMFEYHPSRLSDDDIERAKHLQAEGHVITCGICGAFDILRELMGEENCCIAYYEDPELIFDILNTVSATNQRLLTEITDKMTVDLLAFHGGLDKHVLRKTKEDIQAEIDYKLRPEILEGGVVLGLDHRITNGTPLENYIYYVDTMRERLGLPNFRTSPDGWGRMAV